MANYYHQVGEFNPTKEDWNHCVERVEHFFTADVITNKGKKTALLLTTIGPAAYKLLWNLVGGIRALHLQKLYKHGGSIVVSEERGSQLPRF